MVNALPISCRSLRRAAFAATVFSVVLLLAAPGCNRGPDYPSATVTGQVTIDGQPVPQGAITFSPQGADSGPVTGGPIEDGAYRCELVPLGQHTVTFIAQAAEPDTIVDQVTGTRHEVPRNILPPHYATGVEAEIVAGENRLDFALESQP
jgi:hypothetical protein